MNTRQQRSRAEVRDSTIRRSSSLGRERSDMAGGVKRGRGVPGIDAVERTVASQLIRL